MEHCLRSKECTEESVLMNVFALNHTKLINVILYLMSLLISVSLKFRYHLCSFKPSHTQIGHSSSNFHLQMNKAYTNYRQIVIHNADDDLLSRPLDLLVLSDVNIIRHTVPEKSTAKDKCKWYLFSSKGGYELDSVELEIKYKNSGKTICSDEEIANIWKETIKQRMSWLNKLSLPLVDIDRKDLKELNLSEKYGIELETAKQIVHITSYLSRSLQRVLLHASSSTQSSVSKVDRSPVTIADFTVQALIINYLHQHFPNDLFIAEEDSSVLSTDPVTTNAILDVIESVTSHRWTRDFLFNIIDRGQYDPAKEVASSIGKRRVWVLDPIDGTKGFLRGQHFCIALALMIDEAVCVDEGEGDAVAVSGGSTARLTPVLSVLGCPNLNLHRVLQERSADHPPIGHIDASEVVTIDESLLTRPDQSVYSIQDITRQNRTSTSVVIEYQFSPIDSGSMYFATLGQGAFARSLSMAWDAGFEVTASHEMDASKAILSESTEASHGDRYVSSEVAKLLGLEKMQYVRLDGQCKYCVVGCGAVEGNLRLPPPNYQEKIWDQVPGCLFIQEAGGMVTDLDGNELNFSEGRVMSSSVKGIIASNRVLHEKLLIAVQKARTSDRPQ